jgi:DNA repair protein SbcD/Mre11
MRIAHFADIHIGMQNVGAINPKTGVHTRIEDFENALQQVVAGTFEEEVDIVLFAGDGFRTREPSTTERLVFQRALQQWSSAGIPVVMLTGNHDMHTSAGRATALDIFSEVRGVHVLNKPSVLQLYTNAGSIRIVGAPYPYESAWGKAPNVGQFVYDNLPPDPADNFNVLMGHFTVKGALTGSEQTMMLSDNAVSLEALRPEHFHYVALGHIHRYQNMNPDGATPVMYPGSLEHIDMSEGPLKKGWILVDTMTNCIPSFKEIRVRQFVTIPVDLRTGESLGNQVNRLSWSLSDAVRVVIDTHEDLPRVTPEMVGELIGPVHDLKVVYRVARTARYNVSTVNEHIESLDNDQLLALYLKLKDTEPDRTAALIKFSKQFMYDV